ncbi:hypothetical protein PVAND_011600 [Polypedilum vanderplanki]|uniref:Uncharacterized protein n=1 Tax=Polypedilum vanderplanki TaxID=319348 RepID=A0A9J6CKM9_POLVA|nr:hypothetical protein PVAND_011600 [Polypedilum vanderplanki]
MLENEEPWRPPIQEKLPEKLKIGPEVPEITIIGTEVNKTPKNNNFLQRAITSDKTNRSTENKFSKKTSPYNTFGGSSSSSNHFKLLNRPQVPDLTILDDDENTSKTQQQYNKGSTDRVFTESYKEMLVNSHEQFLKQLGNKSNSKGTDSSSQSVETRKRSPFFMQQAITTQYKQNPLAKYAPKCDQPIINNREKNVNTSSILIDFNKSNNDEKVLHPSKNLTEENDEVTFKKVAEMLNEIQKLTIPTNIQQTEKSLIPNKMCTEDKLKDSNSILRELAKKYLSTEELIKYQIDNELDE